MKSQRHNQGKLKKLTVNIEEDVVKSFELMSKLTSIPIDDLVVIAMKRFKVTHTDYINEDN